MDLTDVESRLHAMLRLYVLPANVATYVHEGDTHSTVSERSASTLTEALKPLLAKVYVLAKSDHHEGYGPPYAAYRDLAEAKARCEADAAEDVALSDYYRWQLAKGEGWKWKELSDGSWEYVAPPLTFDYNIEILEVQ